MTGRWEEGARLAEVRREAAMAPAPDGAEPIPIWGHEGDGAFFVAFNGLSVGFAIFDPEAARRLAARVASDWRERNGAATREHPVAVVHAHRAAPSCNGAAGRGYSVELDGEIHPAGGLAEAQALARRLLAAFHHAAPGQGR